MNPFNLTKLELAMFNEILRLKETSLGNIIKTLGIHKGTAYNSIRRLKEKGLVSYKTVNRVNFYSVVPLSLKALLHEEEEGYKEKIVQIKKFIALAEKNKQESDSCGIQILIGERGFKSFLDDLLNWAYRTKKEYLFIGRGNEISKHLGLNYYRVISAKEKKLKIKYRFILDKNFKKLSSKESSSNSFRYLDMIYLNPVSTWIYKNKVVVVLWDSKPISTIIIESESAVKSYKNFFENLWNSAFAPKTKFESRQKINFYNLIEGAEKSLDFCGINCFIQLHEGRDKIIELLKRNKKVRVLIANPSGQLFKERVFLEECYIKNLKESRILLELKSALANLKDIENRTKKKIEIKFYNSKPDCAIVIVDDNKFLYNGYSDSPEYGSSQSSLIIEKKIYPKEAEEIKKKFEKKWIEAEVLSLSKFL